MRVFLEKRCRNRLSFGGSAPEPSFASSGCIWGLSPQTLALLLPLTITTLSSSFLALKMRFMNKIIAVNVLLLLLPQFCTNFSLQTL